MESGRHPPQILPTSRQQRLLNRPAAHRTHVGQSTGTVKAQTVHSNTVRRRDSDRPVKHNTQERPRQTIPTRHVGDPERPVAQHGQSSPTRYAGETQITQPNTSHGRPRQSSPTQLTRETQTVSSNTAHGRPNQSSPPQLTRERPGYGVKRSPARGVAGTARSGPNSAPVRQRSPTERTEVPTLSPRPITRLHTRVHPAAPSANAKTPPAPSCPGHPANSA